MYDSGIKEFLSKQSTQSCVQILSEEIFGKQLRIAISLMFSKNGSVEHGVFSYVDHCGLLGQLWGDVQASGMY